MLRSILLFSAAALALLFARGACSEPGLIEPESPSAISGTAVSPEFIEPEPLAARIRHEYPYPTGQCHGQSRTGL